MTILNEKGEVNTFPTDLYEIYKHTFHKLYLEGKDSNEAFGIIFSDEFITPVPDTETRIAFAFNILRDTLEDFRAFLPKKIIIEGVNK